LSLIQQDAELRPLHWLYSMNENKGLEKGFKGSYWFFGDKPKEQTGYLDKQRFTTPNL
jgi:hypothetical protein